MRFSDRLKALFGISSPSTDAFFEELSDLLVEGDLGASFAYQVSEELRANCRRAGLRDDDSIKKELKRILSSYCLSVDIEPDPERLNIFLLLGVNGVGKTTSCAKLADYYARRGVSMGVVLAAGDTFRAAAIDQLKIHGERLGIRVVAQSHGSDPGAVLFDAIESAQAHHENLVIGDTAGRMHTRQDLIRELSKIDKIVMSKAFGANYRKFLVLDATTGQNGIRQAESFSEAVKIDGIILTKMDSTAKGGLAIAIPKEFNIPIAYIGKGERYEDLIAFNRDDFLDSFIGI